MSDDVSDNIDNVDLEIEHEEVESPIENDQTFDITEGEAKPVAESEVQHEEVENIDEDEPKKKKKHNPLKAEFNKLQRDKYRFEHENEMLRQENERLALLARETAEAASFHNDKAIELKLAQAKELKARAYEAADTEGMIKADEQLAEAINQKSESDRWKAQQKYNQTQQQRAQQQQQQHQQVEEPVYINEETENWLSNNQWFDPNHRQFNQELAQDVHDYSKILERKYARSGREDMIFSQEYFDDIDKYVHENYSTEPEPPKQQRNNFSMKPVKQNVAPVAKSAKQGAPPNPNRVVLTARERDFAKTMGISEAEYAKQKLSINNSGRYSYENWKR